MPLNLCTDLIIHSEFLPSSSYQDILEPSSPDQTLLMSSIYSLDSFFNKSYVLGPILEPVSDPKPTLNKSDNPFASDSDEEELIICDQPSTSSQTFEPSISEPQTIDIPSPPTHLLDSILFKEVCENLFEDLKKLVEARNNHIHTESYEGRRIELRERIERVMRALQKLYLEAQEQSINHWFQEVLRSMKELEVNKENIKLYISYSPFFVNTSAIISTDVEDDLNLFWLTKLLT